MIAVQHEEAVNYNGWSDTGNALRSRNSENVKRHLRESSRDGPIKI